LHVDESLTKNQPSRKHFELVNDETILFGKTEFG
jgi:hypothetical protein